MVVKLAELFGVEAEFACHLDLFMRESMAFASVDRELEPVVCSAARHNNSKIRLGFYASIVNHPTGSRRVVQHSGENLLRRLQKSIVLQRSGPRFKNIGMRVHP
jgi:hypothetical protein